MKERALHSIMALVLVLGMALTLATPVGAAPPPLNGNVPNDFIGSGILIINDPVPDVGMPGTPPGMTGWDMKDLRLTYVGDTMYVGINVQTILGDADGDGDPSVTSAYLAALGGTDVANLGLSETAAVYFDLNQDGTYDVIAGISSTTDYYGFSVNVFTGPFFPPLNFGAVLPGNIGSISPNPDAAHPDLEFTITNWSTLPGHDAAAGFAVGAFLGSLKDAGIGEDYVSYSQSPSTITTIVSSAPTVVSGGSVSLNVSEYNSGNVSLTNPQVAVTKNGAAFVTLEWPPTSGDDGNHILDPTETWSWTILSFSITGTTTFVARGSGTAPGDFPVNYLTDPLEQDDVTVNTGAPNTTTTIAANATTVPINGKVSLTVTEWNNGSDNLTKPRVEVRQNGTLIATLNSTSPHFSGDGAPFGVLNVGETWRWINIPSNPITAATTFVALGFGTDSLGNEVSYATGYLGERALVTASTPPVGWETYPIDKLRVLLPWIALLAAIMVGAGLLVLRHRRT